MEPAARVDEVASSTDPAVRFEVSVANDFAHVDRIDLDATSWIELVPRLVANAAELLAHLHAACDFEQRRRWIYDRQVDEPRLTADYTDLSTATPALESVALRLSAAYGIDYDRAWVNLYRHERDSTSWHGDASSCRRDVCTVPVLTLGHPRRFLIKPKGGGKSVRVVPESGDLLVMRGRSQVDWLHSVPKQAAPAGPRISVNFASTAQRMPQRAPR